jgi:predicted O-methyltransferase YrrM
VRRFVENWRLKRRLFGAVDGEVCMDRAVLEVMLDAPFDVLPEFEGPPNSTLKRGRGKDHPRYGRFVYALARCCRPEYVVEVGTYAGGTAVGWAAALRDNGRGRLICIDKDVYTSDTFPAVTQRNLSAAGLDGERYELISGDSKAVVPQLAERLRGQVDLYLVDGDHTFEGASADIENGLPMLRPGGLVLVHDVDRGRRMDEQTPEHPHPVYEAFTRAAHEHALEWCILKAIRKHLGILKAR